ncbi:tyrosine-type recombinase/integrase [Sinorhizobium meliloti]|uniref:tyrosine-type recombinase/integrase n=1 Tax=Rhizobium meliloti TaxID=382 RepID=UPI001F1589AF|nr:site-specific integrase [Sinorhizobium meliloti]
MKSGKHPDKALTAMKVRQVSEPGRYADGNGLYLVVDESGAKRWLLRVVVQGKRKDIGLGGLSLVSLAEARERALEYRKLARSGGDPLAAKRAASKIVPTFKVAAETVHAEHRSAWKNGKHNKQWINTLKQYAFPTIGEVRVDRIDTPDILKILAPIWLTKAETARRVRQRIGTVMDWAKAAGHRAGDNPVDGVARGLPKQPGKDRHHKALPYAAVPQFLTELKATHSGEIAKLSFEFLILTATRTSETIEAKWDEFDLEDALWTIPAERMKAKREHRVPLCERCLEILGQAKELSTSSRFVFPGRSLKKPQSNMVFLKIIKTMKAETTAHGFRSSFRDWASEATTFPREIAEMALAHTIENKVEAAYRRGDLLEKRREMMGEWSNYVTSSNPKN